MMERSTGIVVVNGPTLPHLPKNDATVEMKLAAIQRKLFFYGIEHILAHPHSVIGNDPRCSPLFFYRPRLDNSFGYGDCAMAAALSYQWARQVVAPNELAVRKLAYTLRQFNYGHFVTEVSFPPFQFDYSLFFRSLSQKPSLCELVSIPENKTLARPRGYDLKRITNYRELTEGDRIFLITVSCHHTQELNFRVVPPFNIKVDVTEQKGGSIVAHYETQQLFNSIDARYVDHCAEEVVPLSSFKNCTVTTNNQNTASIRSSKVPCLEEVQEAYIAILRARFRGLDDKKTREFMAAPDANEP